MSDLPNWVVSLLWLAGLVGFWAWLLRDFSPADDMDDLPAFDFRADDSD